MYQLLEVTNQTTSPFSWKAYHQTVQKLLQLDPSIHLFYHPSKDEFRQMILGRNQYSKGSFKTFTFFEDEECVGILEVMLQPKLAYLSVLPNHCNEELVDCLSNVYSSFNVESLRITTSQIEVKKMLQKGRGKLLIHDVLQELQRKNVDIEVLEEFAKSGLKFIEEGFELNFYSKLEGEILEKYVAFHNEVIRDILVYDMENGVEKISASMVAEKSEQMQQMGGGFLYLILFDTAENIVGLTEVWIADLKKGNHFNSGLTAIKKAYRKKGIAQFLKASMMQRILRDFEGFAVLETANSMVNEPGLKLNEKFGFQRVSEEFVFELK